MSQPRRGTAPLGNLGDPPRLALLLSLGLALVAAGGLVVSVAVLVTMPSAGLDPTDEGLYLLSADNHQPLAGHNGWFGRYTGLLFAAVGYDIGRFRVAGVVILLASGLVLGGALLRWLTGGRSESVGTAQRLAIVLGIAAAALINYSLFIRSPGYNWLTFVGTTLAIAGIVLVLVARVPLARSTILAGLLVGLGTMLAFWGKASAGSGVAVIAIAAAVAPGLPAARARGAALLVAAGSAAVLLLGHFLFIADPAATVRLFARSAEMVAVMDARHSFLGATREMVGDLLAAPAAILNATSGAALLALLPLALIAAPKATRTRPALLAAAVGVPLVVVSAILLGTGAWRGGSTHYGAVATANGAVLAVAILASVLAWLLARLGEPSEASDPTDPTRRRRVAYGSLAMLGASAVYAFGSANGFVAQTNGVAVLVLATAAAVVAAVLPVRIGAATFGAATAGMAVVAAVILVSARAEPYRMPPLDTATETIPFGRHGQPLSVDAASATHWRELVEDARAACWTPGTKLLDLTWNPADAYALDATVPEVLIPLAGHFVTGTASAQEALRVSDPASWRDAWVITSPDLRQIDPAAVLALAGRTFPSDYTTVATLTSAGLGLRQELWRPGDAAPC
jgi:hypothetical protein